MSWIRRTLLQPPAVRWVEPSESKGSCGSKLARTVVGQVLGGRAFTPKPKRFTLLSVEDFHTLCDEVQDTLQLESATIVDVRPPVKVFGDIHGHLASLLALFRLYGRPLCGGRGDVESMTYLFNGDFVDRGKYSLEVVALLFALKISYPHAIHLIRGNHEDRAINERPGGLLYECLGRLRVDAKEEAVALWSRINDVFDWLPLCAVVNHKVLVAHGGIGTTWQTLDQVRRLKLPLSSTDIDDEHIVYEILWSDPMRPQPTRPGTHRRLLYTQKRVKDFCKRNKLELIVRSHECVNQGYQQASGGRVVTVFSAFNYCQPEPPGNDGALLLITRSRDPNRPDQLVVQPRVVSSANASQRRGALCHTPVPSVDTSKTARVGAEHTAMLELECAPPEHLGVDLGDAAAPEHEHKQQTVVVTPHKKARKKRKAPVAAAVVSGTGGTANRHSRKRQRADTKRGKVWWWPF